MNDKPISFTFEELQRVANAHPAMRISARVRAKVRSNRERGISSGDRRDVYTGTRPGFLGATRALDTKAHSDP